MCLVTLACLRGGGRDGASGGQVRVRPWPALAAARAAGRVPAAVGRLQLAMAPGRHRGCRPQVCAVAAVLSGDCQARRARGQAVVPRGLLAAAAGYQQRPAGLNYDTCLWHAHVVSPSHRFSCMHMHTRAYMTLCASQQDDDKHHVRREEVEEQPGQLARSFLPTQLSGTNMI